MAIIGVNDRSLCACARFSTVSNLALVVCAIEYVRDKEIECACVPVFVYVCVCVCVRLRLHINFFPTIRVSDNRSMYMRTGV